MLQVTVKNCAYVLKFIAQVQSAKRQTTDALFSNNKNTNAVHKMNHHFMPQKSKKQKKVAC
jgi:hypothetical protein